MKSLQEISIIKTALEQVLIIKPPQFTDQRGFFMESFHQQKYQQLLGVNFDIKQINQSYSSQNVLRGLHFQRIKPQSKLISVIVGEIFDVCVDVNPKSSTFGKFISVNLSAENGKQLWIPKGFVHGFCVLSTSAIIQYAVDEFYYPEYDSGIIYNDPDLQINWPISNPILSKKDQHLPTLAEFKM